MDDGFWEGELNGQIGVFPSLVVELVHNEEQEEEEKRETEVRLGFLGGFSDPVNCDISYSSVFIFSPAYPHPNHASLLTTPPRVPNSWL